MTDGSESSAGGDRDDDTGGRGPTRRQVLAGGGLGALGIGAYALYDGDVLGGDRAAGRGVFDVWRDAQSSLRASPDHGPGRADALVEDGSPRDIFEFVRDEVATKPTNVEDTGRFDLAEAVWGGHRAALRSRVGTPREKADLLADLLARAGLDAEVKESSRGVDSGGFRDEEFFRPPDLTFDPDATAAEQRRWLEAVGTDPGTGDDVAIFDAGGDESATLAADLRSAFDPATDAEIEEFTWNGASTRPIVRFREDDQDPWRYADLFPQGEEFGTEAPDASISDVDDRVAPEVQVTVEGIPAADPADADARVELVSGTWDGPALAGRQLIVTFLPDVTPFDVPQVRFRDVTRFVPALTVQDPHADQDELEAMTVMGDPFDRDGERVELDDGDGGEVSDPTELDGGAEASGESSDALDGVTALDASLEGISYPDVSITADVLDEDGSTVENVPGAAFAVAEDGEPVSATVDSRSRTPTVALLVDESGSMPSYGFDDATRAEIRRGLEDRIREVDPEASVSLEATDSNLYSWAAETARSPVDAIVYVSDGDQTDSLSAPRERALATGPPIVAVSVLEEASEAMETLADRSDGAVVTWEDREQTEAAVRDFVEELLPEVRPYKLRYRSPHGHEPGTEVEVTFSLPGADLEEVLTYEVPAETVDVGDPLVGLAVSVEVGDLECERVLAGFDPIVEEGADPGDGHVAETEAALFGDYVLSFEADGVPPAVHLEDVVAGNLTVEPLDEHRRDGDPEEFRDLLADGAGVGTLSCWAQLLHAPYPDQVTTESLTYDAGLRCTLFGRRPVFGAEYVVRSIDVLPTHRTRTVRADDDHERAFEQTLERTARAMVVEREAFDTSTASLLADADLRPEPAVSDEWDEETAERFDRVRERGGYDSSFDVTRLHIVGAADPPDAFWAIDSATGQLTGVLPDGSGGGSSEERILDQLGRIERASAVMSLWLGAGGAVIPGSTAMGVVVAYFVLLSKLYGIASVSVATMSAEDVEQDVFEAIARFVCNLATGYAMGMAEDAGDLAEFMNNASVAGGGDAFYGC